MKIIDEINEIKGTYYFKSPYHKNKQLPFVVTGYSHSSDFPVQVLTVEYKGHVALPVESGYSLSSVQDMILRGFLKKQPFNH